MCGITGCAGEIAMKHEKLFKQMLIVDSLRGEHSTGIAHVSKIAGNVVVAKSLGNPFELFDSNHFIKAMQPMPRVLIGHNRFATTGKVNKANAHPFDFDDLVGVHNGTLTNKIDLKDHNSFDTDSEALYHNIIEDGVEKAIGKTRGAWALVWWDKNNELLNFLRNEERPLFIGTTEDTKVMLWASEEWMIEVLAMREGIKMGDIKLLPKDTLHSFHIDKDGKIFKPRTKKIEGAKSFTNVAYSGKWKSEPAKKTQALPLKNSTSSLAYDEQFLGSKLEGLELMSLDCDHNGSKFIHVFHNDYPLHDIRLYVHQNDIVVKKIGAKVKGAISSVAYDLDKRPFYKLSPWTVEFMENTHIKDHKGNPVDRERWEKEFHTCGWCSSSCEYGGSHHIMPNGDVICEDCVKEPQVAQYLHLPENWE